MNGEDDIDMLAQKKSVIKQGRRARMTHSPDTQDISLDSEPGSPGGPAPSRTRKTGHWADEGSKLTRKSAHNLIELERFKDPYKQDSDDDIPIIPDIDDIQDEILTLHDTAKTLSVSVNKATYKELDSEFGNLQKKLAQVGNINLAFLATHLYSEADVKEVDELWTMEDLFDTMLSCNK